MKKKLRKVWNNYLIISIPINIISLIICACCLDSESILPIIVGMINLIWIALIVVANSDEEPKRKDKDDEIIVEENRIA